MKRFCVFLAVIVLMGMAASFFVLADSTYFDECESADNTEFISYSNLRAASPDFGEEVGWPNAPDSTVLTADFAGGPPSAIYHISGVDRLTVSCYLPMSPMASRNMYGDYVLMDVAGDPEGTMDLDGALPVSYSPVDGNLYLHTPDEGYLLYMVEKGAGVFRPLPDEDVFLSQIKDTLTTSFLEVLVSDDGESYHSLDYDIASCRMSLESSSPLTYYYTTLYLPIPSGTRYIGLQMNYPEEIPMADGGTLHNPNGDMMRLARVDFQGEYLNWGDPPPDEEEEPDPMFNVEGFYIIHRSSASSRNTSGDKITQYFEITNNYYNGAGPSSGGSQVSSGESGGKMKLILSDEAAVPVAGGQGERRTNNVLILVCSLIYLMLAMAAVAVLIFKFRSYHANDN
ncbi:hypothetical protein [Zongyangia hominis]|nr:hypothetical protein [Zongyangia hominis]